MSNTVVIKTYMKGESQPKEPDILSGYQGPSHMFQPRIEDHAAAGLRLFSRAPRLSRPLHTPSVLHPARFLPRDETSQDNFTRQVGLASFLGTECSTSIPAPQMQSSNRARRFTQREYPYWIQGCQSHRTSDNPLHRRIEPRGARDVLRLHR